MQNGGISGISSNIALELVAATNRVAWSRSFDVFIEPLCVHQLPPDPYFPVA